MSPANASVISILHSQQPWRLFMRNVFFLCFLVFGISCACLARTDQSSWTNLSALQAGQKIQIVGTNSKQYSGAFTSVSDKAISYQSSAGEQSVQRQDVRSVKLMENKHRLRNTLIGGGVGAGAGAGITAAAWENRGFLGSKRSGAAVGAVIGFFSGAVIGALIPSHKMIYSVNSQ
jgi:hypothetical protein